MKLTGSQFEQLEQALISAYPGPEALRRMTRIQLEESCLQAVAWEKPLLECVDQLIEWSEAQGTIIDLIRGAHRRNSANELLRKFCHDHSLLLLVEACRGTSTLFEFKTVQVLAKLVLAQGDSFEMVCRAGLEVLPDGVRDSDRHCYLADFQSPALLPLLRWYGFLKLALADYPQNEQGQLTLLRFAQQLLARSEPVFPDQASLSEWLAQALGADRSQVVQRKKSRRNQFNGCLEVSLMVTVRPSTQQPKAGEHKESHYRVNGYLLFDCISDRPQPCLEPKPLQELSLPNVADQLGVVCLSSKIPEKIGQFIDVALLQLDSSLKQELKYRRYKLTLELFLPVGQMSLDVDQWPRGERQTPIGKDYGVIVRFCDRIDDPERKNALFETWDDLQAHLKPPHNLQTLKKHVEAPQCLSEYESWNQLEANLRHKLGLKLGCGLPEAEPDRKGLFEAILFSDTPVAVWTRCTDWATAKADTETSVKPNQTVNISDALNTFLEADCMGPPAVVAAKLKNVRNQAWGAPSAQQGQCLGDHMAFLLDNPDRLPILPPLQAS